MSKSKPWFSWLQRLKRTSPDQLADLSASAFANLIGSKTVLPRPPPSYLLDDNSDVDDEKTYVIKTITASQEDQLAVFQDEWIAAGLSTEPTDRARAEDGIRLAYDVVGRKPPKIFWLSSPMKGVIATAFARSDSVTLDVFDEVLKKARDTVQAAVSPPVLLQIRQAILDPIGDRIAAVMPYIGAELSNRVSALKMDGAEEVVQATISDACFGCHDAAWMGFYSYCQHVLGLDLGHLEGLMQVARSGGWFWPMKTAVIATDRPTAIRLDEKNRLHALDARVVEYGDGFGLCAWHGVRVPETAIFSPDEVPWKDVEELADQDLRSALAEIKALQWSGGDEEGEEFAAAMAAKRLGGIDAVKGLIEDEKK